MIKRLSHACLGATDLQKTIDFYCNLLGCQVIYEFKNPYGELYGIFMLVKNGTFLEFFKEQEPKPSGGLFRHLCFEVEDINKWADLITEKGYNANVYRSDRDGAWQFWIEDPDGNKIEFHQYDAQSVQYIYSK
ncbi:VOC family protein [Microcoleus sp.]|jgi:lactoylglutathione lyase|uniref:VOC family protein n=1 Tax=Microcoleus sp. TaxID=44472 RepID=UPI0035237459